MVWAPLGATTTAGAELSGALPHTPDQSAGELHDPFADQISLRSPLAPSQNTTCSPLGVSDAAGADSSIWLGDHPADRLTGGVQPPSYVACQSWPEVPRQYTDWTPPGVDTTDGADARVAAPFHIDVQSAGPLQVAPVDHVSRRCPSPPCQKTSCCWAVAATASLPAARGDSAGLRSHPRTGVYPLATTVDPLRPSVSVPLAVPFSWTMVSEPEDTEVITATCPLESQ